MANKNVNACSKELGTLTDFAPFGAGECNPQSCPIHAVDQPDPFGVSIGDENAYRERIGHLLANHLEFEEYSVPILDNASSVRTFYLILGRAHL